MSINIRCGKCQQTHSSIAAVRACHDGALTTCGWHVMVPGRWVDAEWTNDDGTVEVTQDYIEDREAPCGAETIHTDRGWSCDAGHEHVNIEARVAEGWDYAEDAGEAYAMVGAGVQPYTMDGHVATSARDFAPAWAR